jgi:microcystin-dependent protein
MASTYTVNTGIEKPGSGEQSGTWGTTTNTNFDIIDRSLNGVGNITLTGTTHTLSTSDGSLSDGHYRVLVLGGSPTGTNTISISPTDQEKVYLVYNNSGQSAVFTQGSGGNATITNGATAWIYADGGGATAQVKAVPADLIDDPSPQLGGNLDVNGNSIVSASNGDIAITPNGTGDVIIDGIKYPQADGNANDILTTDGAGQLSFTALGSANTFASGMLMPYAGATAPTGWLLCYGQAISRTTYADLYAVVGTTYGAGDGSTTFNLPDLRGRVVAGKDDMGGVSANRLTNQTGGLDGDGLGNTGGAETHTLALTEMPNSFYYNSNLLSVDDYVDNHAGSNFTARVADVTSHTTQGGGGAHNNVQPTFILTYIIKT